MGMISIGQKRKPSTKDEYGDLETNRNGNQKMFNYSTLRDKGNDKKKGNKQLGVPVDVVNQSSESCLVSGVPLKCTLNRWGTLPASRTLPEKALVIGK